MPALNNILERSDRQSTVHKSILSHSGDSALLLTPSEGSFNPGIQIRLFALVKQLKGEALRQTFVEAVLGVNNLLVLFDASHISAGEASGLLLELWEACDATDMPGRNIEIPVVYGGQAGEDLAMLAQTSGMSIPDYIERHSEASYTAACIGAYPGFVFLSGLPAALAIARRATPRLKVPKGAVIVGGAQAGVMPCSAPSGWHILGTTDTSMFDLGRPSPCLVQPGDHVRFTIRRLEHD